ncbi:MAG: c-type cytochrome [Verrucomicrobiales bacterium]
MRTTVLLALSITAILTWMVVRRPHSAVTGEPSTAPPLTTYQRICLQCHGPEAGGNAELKAPSIAGQPEWHLQTQLSKFRQGHRGTDPRDTPGQQMRAIAVTLSEDELAEATQFISKLPSIPTKATQAGDAVRGRVIYEEQCIDCHRYNGSGEQVFGSSPLTGFQDWYLSAQIEKYRIGSRGYHPDDEKGMQMRHLLSYLADGDADDLAAYIATLADRYPPGQRKR